MLIKKPTAIRPSEITDQSVWQQRRQLLKAAALLGATAALPRFGIAKETTTQTIEPLKKSTFSTSEPLTAYRHVTGYNNFYEFGPGKTDPAKFADDYQPGPWTVTVDGECDRPGQIDLDQIMSLFRQEERIYRMRCVEGWAMVIPWVGFPLSALLKRFQPNSKAKYVAFTTLHDPNLLPGQRRPILDWPYQEGLRMDEAMHPLTILSTGLYGKTLPIQNGAPIRLVVPWKYGFKSIKSIVKITLTEQQPLTTWSRLSPSEYGFYANVNPAVNHPRWSQKYHRIIGEGIFAEKHPTLPFNGYADEVAHLYQDMDLKRFF